MFEQTREKILRRLSNTVMQLVRSEYTVLPRFGFHQPLDYGMDTFPPDFDAPVKLASDPLPLPPPKERMGYSADNEEYLRWGKYDHDLVLSHIKKYYGEREGVAILDFGCSSGRVLRHFYPQHREQGWHLFGVDIQARPVEWMRQNFPNEFCVYTGTVLPKLPFADNSLDVIYGISVFTHIKYLWDMWLLELKRVLKPGGLLIQTFHSENAWDFYYKNRNEAWVKNGHSPYMLSKPSMPHPFFHYGDISVSQAFWTQETARSYWGRYLKVLEITPPPEKYSFQDWIVCAKPE